MVMMVITGCESDNNVFSPESATQNDVNLDGKFTRSTVSINPENGPYTAIAYGDYNEAGYQSQDFNLWAGQNNLAGTVTISNDESNIYVNFDTDESADLSAVHVYVYSNVEDVPDRRPAPGQTDYKADSFVADSYTVTIPFADLGTEVNCGDTYYVIAHAALTGDDASDNDQDADSDLNNSGETAYAGGNGNELPEVGGGGGSWFYVAQYNVICGDGNGGGDDEDPVYEINGVVFYDIDGNGIQDEGEPGISGVDVTLNDGTVVFTDENGNYIFAELVAGDYTVTVGEYNNRNHTTPSVVDVTIVDSDVTVNFGFEPYHISGVVFYDIDGDGFQDVDEPGIEGIEVILSDGTSMTTDASGSYLFEGLLPGDYEVSVQDIDGFNPTTATSVELTIIDSDPVVDFGFELVFENICGQVADGYTIGYWKTNISKAIAGRTKGIQIPAETLESYVTELSSFALYPLNFQSLQDAENVLSANGSDEVLLLSKQLAGSELNFMNGAYIGGNELVTWAFVYYGEYVLAHSGDYSRDEILEAKDWFDAYNNSHGGQFFGPGCE